MKDITKSLTMGGVFCERRGWNRYDKAVKIDRKWHLINESTEDSPRKP